MGKALANGPISVVATAVFDDGDVAGFTSWSALVVGFERIVLLINDDVNGRIASKLTHFDHFDVSELVPVGVSALIACNPNVFTLVEVPKSVVVEDGHGVCAVGRNGHVVVAVAIEIANGDIHRIAIRGVGACNRGAGRGGQRSGGAEHHQQRQEDAAHSGFREVILG